MNVGLDVLNFQRPNARVRTRQHAGPSVPSGIRCGYWDVSSTDIWRELSIRASSLRSGFFRVRGGRVSLVPFDPSRWFVLIVSEDEDAREMYGSWLAFAGFAVATVGSVREGHEAATHCYPRLVVVNDSKSHDLPMSLCRALRYDIRTTRIPIVLVTGNQLPQHLDAAIENGCVAVRLTPYLPDAA